MTNKYNIKLSVDTIEQTFQRLTNQIYRLLPLREENKDWLSPLDSLIVELSGLCEICADQQVLFLEILSRLEGIKKQNDSYELFRRTIFKTISLLNKVQGQCR